MRNTLLVAPVVPLVFGLACGWLPNPATAPEPPPGPPARPDIVIVTVDGLRADQLDGTYYRVVAPHLLELAGDSISLTQATTPIPNQVGGSASLLTGRYAYEHGLLSGDDVHDGDEMFLQEFLAEHGYGTAAFLATDQMSGTGLDNGFGTWSDGGGPPRDAAAVVDDALAWYAGQPEGAPRFAWVAVRDLVKPAQPKWAEGEPGPQATWIAERQLMPVDGQDPTEVLDVNDGSLAYVDAQIGRLLDAIEPQRDNTIVVLTSPFGNGLGQHDGVEELWGEVVHVPLLVRAPGQPTGEVDTVVSLVDVVPSLLYLVALDGEEVLGEQLSGANALSGEARQQPAFSQVASRSVRKGQPVGFALTSRDWKYIYRDGEPELLFDLMRDPFEIEDVSAENSHIILRYREHLRWALKAQGNPVDLEGAAPAVRDSDEEGLVEEGEEPSQFAGWEQPKSGKGDGKGDGKKGDGKGDGKKGDGKGDGHKGGDGKGDGHKGDGKGDGKKGDGKGGDHKGDGHKGGDGKGDGKKGDGKGGGGGKGKH